MTEFTYDMMKQMLRIERYNEIANYDKVVDLGINAMWKELSSKVSGSDNDPTEIFSEELETLRSTEYSMKLMNICCLSEMWEQDLYNFLKEQGLIEISSNDYRNTKRVFEQAYPTCVISNYPKIEEMRALVNAIKHGEGNSLQNIRRLTSDKILADSNIGEVNENGKITKKREIDFDGNTLTSKTLNVDGKLQMYSEALIAFWKDVFLIQNQNLESPEL